MTANHTVKRLADYKPPAFLVETIDLRFLLEKGETLVCSQMTIKRVSPGADKLVLDGVDLQLLSLSIDQTPVVDYQQDADSLSLTIPLELDTFSLTINNKISPELNTSLEGLYYADGTFCSQCEAEGFRKITYCLDRPDVLSTYRVYIEADQQRYPFLLSNGNKQDSGALDNGRHYVQWHDPHPKPCYLFALVAGDFELLTRQFISQSGRQIALQLYVQQGQQHRGTHALDSLVKSMQWDQEKYGLEYDLDIYMVVAVDFFNMGAMENKGLNVFNSKCVLADPSSATDDDFFNIESIIAHEYFHNWTGNRVTCRDWFQLSLKEGLTVFRDQQFSSDMASPLVNRIRQVRVMRDHQFAEDAGPLAHPIRPEQVIEMNNFYTVTVYDKGAEVIRMMHTLLGAEGFRSGVDLYFQRHDGQAVTCDDFVSAMEDASGVCLQQFRLWYSQSGTPRVTISTEYCASRKQLTLHCRQHTQETADQREKVALHIPCSIEALAEDGTPLTLKNGQSNEVVSITEGQQRFIFDVSEAPAAVAVFTGFSAPCLVDYALSDHQLRHLLLYATDDFTRWDASQTLFLRAIADLMEDRKSTNYQVLLNSLKHLLEHEENQALLAECLTLPSLETVMQQQQNNIDVRHCYKVLQDVEKKLACDLKDFCQQRLAPLSLPLAYCYQQPDVECRRLVGVLLRLLGLSNSLHVDQLKQRYHKATNMTDTLNLLRVCQQIDIPLFDQLMAEFEKQWKNDVLVLDKWFALSASTERCNISTVMQRVIQHPSYSIENPNRVRSVWSSYTRGNPMAFHAKDGSGYQLLADYLLLLDKINPQVTSRLVEPLLAWKRYHPSYQSQMSDQLRRLAAEKLSPDLYEKVNKALN